MTNPNALQWFKRRRAARARGVLLAGGADILGGAGSWNTAGMVGILVRMAPVVLPANATLSIAMLGDFSALFNYIVSSWTSGLVGAVVAFNGAYSTSPVYGVDVMQPGSLGKMHAAYIRLIPGAFLEYWLDQKQVGFRGATAAVTLGGAANLAINRRVGSDTLPFGSMAFGEIRATTTALTDAQIAAACAAPLGTPLIGECNAVVGSDMIGASIAPRVGGGTYAVTGSPPIVSYPVARKGLGTVEQIADSRVGRNAATFLGAGDRRECAQIVNQSRHVTFTGQFPYTDPATVLDFSPYHTGVGGMGLGASPGAGATRLASVGTDRGLSIGATGITMIDMGINDIFRRCRSTELAQAPATAVAAMVVDWDAEISGLRVVRTGPIVISTVPRSSDGTTEANQITACNQWNAALPANVATWNATYGSVYLWDPLPDIIAAFGAAYYNDTGCLFDGLHYTPAMYSALAASRARFLLTLP